MLHAKQTAFVFPGQGAQFVGMASALAARYHVARQTFEEADNILGFELSRLAFEGPEEQLTDTANAQPALYVAGIAALRALYESWQTDFKPAFMAGHSLGEFTALTAAGAISFPDGLKLVRRRGELMRDADLGGKGGMAAILGLTVPQVEVACSQAQEAVGEPVVVANDNCPGQVVISGHIDALQVAMKQAEASGARKTIRLAVSTAPHSPLMASAAEDFKQALNAAPFHPPRIPIVGNTTATPLSDEASIRAELSEQLIGRVRWTESVRTMLQAGVTTFVELGSGGVLTGLIKRIERNTERFVVDMPTDVEKLPPAAME
ncbi:MAG: ACP S-malonyltransferase [Chloroflexi bacterium]|nr:ACP S-malonyltransferase [Chloroflexota bacterium]